MSSCSFVIVHASLKNMVSRKTRLKFLVPNTGGRTWRDKKNSWLPQFFEFRPEILHAYFWMHMQSNNNEKKYIDLLTHLQEKLPLKFCNFSQWHVSFRRWFSLVQRQFRNFAAVVNLRQFALWQLRATNFKSANMANEQLHKIDVSLMFFLHSSHIDGRPNCSTSICPQLSLKL